MVDSTPSTPERSTAVGQYSENNMEIFSDGSPEFGDLVSLRGLWEAEENEGRFDLPATKSDLQSLTTNIEEIASTAESRISDMMNNLSLCNGRINRITRETNNGMKLVRYADRAVGILREHVESLQRITTEMHTKVGNHKTVLDIHVSQTFDQRHQLRAVVDQVNNIRVNVEKMGLNLEEMQGRTTRIEDRTNNIVLRKWEGTCDFHKHESTNIKLENLSQRLVDAEREITDMKTKEKNENGTQRLVAGASLCILLVALIIGKWWNEVVM